MDQGEVAMITQTRFGRLLCWLGLHLLVWRTIDNVQPGYGTGSIVGGCIRCNRSLQWDF